MRNPIVFDAGTRIGNISAEADDYFLFECFYDHPALAEMSEISSPKSFLLGNTGAGKTAILRMLPRHEEHCERIELEEMAMNYVSNSDIIQFLDGLDIELDLFFQALWKHVICLEFIRVKFDVNDRVKSVNIIERFLSKFEMDAKRKRALDYLKKWQDSFWISMDENIREITEKLEKNVELELGGDVEKFKARAGYIRSLSREKKTHLRERAKKFVDAQLLSDLAQVIGILSDYKEGKPKKFYILIDKLDENWVASTIRYKMIRALIEALKSLRRIHDLKVIVAIRSDLLEKVILETKEAGFQSEKYEDYMMRINWTSRQLKDLVNKRINFLFKRKYSKENVFFEEIFSSKIHRKDPFDYMIERTLMRPRDIINFVNFCLEGAEGSVSVNQSTLLSAERVYSENRLQALIEEWKAVYPGIEAILEVIKQKNSSFGLHELNTSKFVDDLTLHFLKKNEFQRDSIWGMINSMGESSNDAAVLDLLGEVIKRLYDVGAVGVKLGSTESFQWMYKAQKPISDAAINNDATIRVHPMLYSACGIRQFHR